MRSGLKVICRILHTLLARPDNSITRDILEACCLCVTWCSSGAHGTTKYQILGLRVKGALKARHFGCRLTSKLTR